MQTKDIILTKLSNLNNKEMDNKCYKPLRDLLHKYDIPKLGRWVYCKYCYCNVLPQIGDGVVQCTKCGYGLAPLDEIIKMGSYQKWWSSLNEKYTNKLEEGLQ